MNYQLLVMTFFLGAAVGMLYKIHRKLQDIYLALILKKK